MIKTGIATILLTMVMICCGYTAHAGEDVYNATVNESTIKNQASEPNVSEAEEEDEPNVVNNYVTIHGDYNNNTNSYNNDNDSITDNDTVTDNSRTDINNTTDVKNNTSNTSNSTKDENTTNHNNSTVNNDNNDDYWHVPDDNSTTTSNNTVNVKKYNVILGDPANDINPDDNVVTVKNIKCPRCSSHTYTENYNLKDVNLQHYMGRCSTCYYEN